MIAKLAAVVAALALVSAAPAAAEPRDWVIVPSGSGSGNLNSVAALCDGDVWAAGFAVYQDTIEGHIVTGFDPMVRHWDGRTWAEVPTPSLGKGNSGRFQAIAARSSTDVWAVGDRRQDDTGYNGPLIERWDGTAWSLATADEVPGARSSALFGVTAISRNDAWAVGSAAFDGRSEPVAQHWDGHRWTLTPLPSDLGSAALNAVAARGPADVWAAGFLTGSPVTGKPSEPLLLHWDGVSWSRVALPSTVALGLARLSAITLSGGEVLAVGESTIGGAINRKPLAFRIGHGGATTEHTPDEQGQLNGVTVVDGQAWAVGYRYDQESGRPLSYALVRRSDGTWQRATAPEAPGATLFGVTAVPHSKTLWTTGAMDGTAPGLPAPLVARR